MAVRSLRKSLRISGSGLFVLAAIGCSSSNFSASGGSSGDAGEAGDDSGAGRPSAGRAGATNRAGAGGTSADAGASDGGTGEAAGEAGEGGASAGGEGNRAGAPSAGSAGLDGSAGNGGSNGGSGGTAGSELGGSSGAAQAGSSSAGSSGACASPITFYADDDKDDFGRSTSMVKACTEPLLGTWALKGGDCNDDNKQVFPLQPTYRGVGYVVASGTSFDYDCSGQEEADPTQLGLAPACPGSFLNCAGTGFKNTGRVGAGVNPICGSTTVITCTPNGLGCTAVETAVPASRCR